MCIVQTMEQYLAIIIKAESDWPESSNLKQKELEQLEFLAMSGKKK